MRPPDLMGPAAVTAATPIATYLARIAVCQERGRGCFLISSCCPCVSLVFTINSLGSRFLQQFGH